MAVLKHQVPAGPGKGELCARIAGKGCLPPRDSGDTGKFFHLAFKVGIGSKLKMLVVRLTEKNVAAQCPVLIHDNISPVPVDWDIIRFAVEWVRGDFRKCVVS